MPPLAVPRLASRRREPGKAPPRAAATLVLPVVSRSAESLHSSGVRRMPRAPRSARIAAAAPQLPHEASRGLARRAEAAAACGCSAEAAGPSAAPGTLRREPPSHPEMRRSTTPAARTPRASPHRNLEHRTRRSPGPLPSFVRLLGRADAAPGSTSPSTRHSLFESAASPFASPPSRRAPEIPSARGDRPLTSCCRHATWPAWTWRCGHARGRAPAPAPSFSAWSKRCQTTEARRLCLAGWSTHSMSGSKPEASSRRYRRLAAWTVWSNNWSSFEGRARTGSRRARRRARGAHCGSTPSRSPADPGMSVREAPWQRAPTSGCSTGTPPV